MENPTNMTAEYTANVKANIVQTDKPLDIVRLIVAA